MNDHAVLIGFVISAVAATVMVVMAIVYMLGYVRLRQDLARRGLEAGHDDNLPLKDRMAGRLLPLAVRMFKPSDEADLAGLRLRLAQAGMSTQKAVDTYMVIQIYCLLVAGALVIPWFFLDEPAFILIGFALSLLIGFLAPRLWLSIRKSKRETKIALSLASTLDLLVTCMEAGLGLEQAMERVSSELAFSETEMAEEFKITITEIRAGIPVSQAFRKMSQRVELNEMHMLCSIIIQASALGASIGQMLRQYSASWRNQRMMDLEERAGKVTAALTLPLTLCLLPSSLLAMLGPAVIVVFRNLVF